MQVQALEKYLMTKLYERTFRQSADDVERDDILALRCSALQFVIPAHLEIPEGIVDEQAMARAAAELNKMNQYKVGGLLPCHDTSSSSLQHGSRRSSCVGTLHLFGFVFFHLLAAGSLTFR